MKRSASPTSARAGAKRRKSAKLFAATFACREGEKNTLSVEMFPSEKKAAQHLVNLAVPMLLRPPSDTGSDSSSDSDTDADSDDEGEGFREAVRSSVETSKESKGDPMILLHKIRKHIRDHGWPMQLSIDKIALSGGPIGLDLPKAVVLVVRERFELMEVEGIPDLPEARVRAIFAYSASPQSTPDEVIKAALASQARVVLNAFCITGHVHSILSTMSTESKAVDAETDSDSDSDSEESEAAVGPAFESKGEMPVESSPALVELIASAKSAPIQSDLSLLERLNRIMDLPSGEFSRVSIKQFIL